MTAPEHVCIVGCGFTGTSTLFQLVDRYPVKRITIIEQGERFGPGFPYDLAECPDYLVNNTTDTMCLVPSNRRAFVEWARQQAQYGKELDETGHLPRTAYGAFLEDVFRSACTAAAIKGIAVERVNAEVTAMREDARGKVHVAWAGGATTADIAIIATGRSPYVERFPVPPSGAAARYIANHIRNHTLEDIPLDATVHVLGTSLSAYDIVNRLFSARTGCRFEPAPDGTFVFEPGPNRRKIVLASRTGRLKKHRSVEPRPLVLRHFTIDNLRRMAGTKGGLTLDDVRRLVDAEAAANGTAIDWSGIADPYAGCTSRDAVNARAGDILAADLAAAKAGGNANFIVDLLGAAQMTIWRAFGERLLAPEAEKAYRERYERATLCYAAPSALPTGERLLALHKAERIEVVKGVHNVSLAPDGSHYAIAHDCGSERADILINTTGALNRRVTSAGQGALVTSLVANGLMSPYRRGGEEAEGAAVDMNTYRLTGAKNIYLANMLLWGPGFFTSSAYLMAVVAERILQAAFDQR